MWSSIQLVSVLGSLLVLVAYVATQFGYLSAKGLAYAFANIVGSGILAVVATLEAQWGFLELPPIGNAAECKVGTDARSFGEFSKLPKEGASPCPLCHHTSSIP